MSIALSSLHIGLKSNETESKAFSLPSESAGQGYCIRTILIADSSQVPDKISLEKEQSDNINSNETRWTEIGIGKRTKQNYATYDYSWTGEIVNDRDRIPRVYSSDNMYRLRADKSGVTVYFVPFAYDQEMRSEKPLRTLMDNMCIMQEFLDKCVADNEDLKLRIKTLERVVYEVQPNETSQDK